MIWLLLAAGCMKPAVDPLFPIPAGPFAGKRAPVVVEPDPQAEAKECVATCLQRNMARAVAWEIVVADCEADCGLRRESKARKGR